MARLRKEFTIESANRDKGKTFVVTEMDSFAGFDWATRALFGMLNAGMEVSEELIQMGLGGVAMMGLDGIKKLPPSIVKPLMEELQGCVQIKEPGGLRAVLRSDIEEISTWFEMQKRAFTLHIEPFTSGGGQNSQSVQPVAAQG